MLRKRKGITNYVNFITIVYSAMELLPYKKSEFSKLKKESTQVKKYLIVEALQKEVFFCTSMDSSEGGINSNNHWKAFYSSVYFDFAS